MVKVQEMVPAAVTPIGKLEQLVRLGPTEDNFEAARAVLRTWLLEQAGTSSKGHSIADGR